MKKIDSERAEILDLIDRAFISLGGRATKAEVVAALKLPKHLFDYCARQGLRTAVNSYFTKRGSAGLPQAPEVDSGGTHAQLELLTEDDYRYLVESYRVRGSSNYRRAHEFVARCKAHYGVVIDIHNPLGREVAS